MGRGPRGDVLCLPKITCTPWFHALVGPGDNEADWKCLGPLDWMSRSCTSSNLNYYRNDLPSNRTLPSSWNPHFQTEAKYTTFLVKMSFICMRLKNHFHIWGWALNLVFTEDRGNSGMAHYSYCTQKGNSQVQWKHFWMMKFQTAAVHYPSSLLGFKHIRSKRN